MNSFFGWVQATIIGKGGKVGEVSIDNQFRVTDRDFFTSHTNIVKVNTSLVTERNHYSTGILFIDTGITLTVDVGAVLYIVEP